MSSGLVSGAGAARRRDPKRFQATLDTAAPALAEHPSAEELDEALDEVLALQRTAAELAQAIREAQAKRARRRPVEVA